MHPEHRAARGNGVLYLVKCTYKEQQGTEREGIKIVWQCQINKYNIPEYIYIYNIHRSKKWNVVKIGDLCEGCLTV